jgi:hypothetical protein
MAMDISLFGRPLVVSRRYVRLHEWQPHVWMDLFSWHQRLFAWTPLILVATVGLIWAVYRPRTRLAASTGIVALSINVLLIGVLPYSPVFIGQRDLINCVPFFMVGLG